MASKTRKVSTMLEPDIEESLKLLAYKKDMTASSLIRELVIDILHFNGMLPDSIKLLKAS